MRSSATTDGTTQSARRGLLTTVVLVVSLVVPAWAGAAPWHPVLGWAEGAPPTSRPCAAAAGMEVAALAGRELREASGLAASALVPGRLYAHNDSGDSQRLLVLTTAGRALGQLRMGVLPQRDWEDIDVGPGPVAGIPYLYVADIGGNVARQSIRLLRLPEPGSNLPPGRVAVDTDAITASYPDGHRGDAEALIIDPWANTAYIVEKRVAEPGGRMFALPNLSTAASGVRLEEAGRVPLAGVTAGTLTPDGRLLLVRSESQIMAFRHKRGHPLAGSLDAGPCAVWPASEQGESIAVDGAGAAWAVPEGLPATLWRYL